MDSECSGEAFDTPDTESSTRRCTVCDVALSETNTRARCWGCTSRRGKSFASNKDVQVDIKLAAHTIRLTLEKMESALLAPTRTELQHLLVDIVSDVGLVQRTVDGVARRMR